MAAASISTVDPAVVVGPAPADGAQQGGATASGPFAALLAGATGQSGTKDGKGDKASTAETAQAAADLPATPPKSGTGAEALDATAVLLLLQLTNPVTPAVVMVGQAPQGDVGQGKTGATQAIAAAPESASNSGAAQPVAVAAQSVTLDPALPVGQAAEQPKAAHAQAVATAAPEQPISPSPISEWERGSGGEGATQALDVASPSDAISTPTAPVPAEAPPASAPVVPDPAVGSTPVVSRMAGAVAQAVEALTGAVRWGASKASAPPDGTPPDPGPTQDSPGGGLSTQNSTSVVRSDGNAQQDPGTGDHAGQDGNPRTNQTAAVEHGEKSPVGADGQPYVSATTTQLKETQTATVQPPATTGARALPEAIRQVSNVVIDRAQSGGGEAHLRLNPAELGRVDVHVRVHDGGVTVEVQAERPEAARLIQDHQAELTALLGQRGLDLSSLNVGLSGRQAGDAQQDAATQRGARPAGGEFAAILGIDTTPVEASNRLRAAYNPDGAHLFRV